MISDEPEGVFRVSEGRAAGWSRARMRSAGVSAPIFGVRSTTPVVTLGDRCAAVLHRLGDHVFLCGPTAALLWGAPLDRRWEQRLVLDVAVAAPARAPHADGLAGRSLRIDRSADLVVGRRGALTSPARTWCDLGAVLDLPDLVAVGDDLLHRRLVSLSLLEATVARYPGRRGIARLRPALGLLDARAESRPESRVRVALVLAGITGIEANVEIYDETGVFLGRVDLCLAWARVIVEYHGDHHRSEPGRWRKDIARARRLRAAGWNVIELTGDDLADLSAVVAQVRSALPR
ncbi:DUF559 domain-containing protein [Rathayibacter sp. VKM Ac-2760]|uniref:DUF559 domain-containing protein n=1 Tax=Rathayibacter sp. VKM Ac-2760 TaxID=2609253 RepID=UPI0013160CBB|nr:DUF559 domain-containing protein [Rathayibacter sp. VKM Ac-2760]QHC59812.1 DUF559 domain-containing protein [Rathayibacter sp. VKM Ac-2760]